MRMMDELLKEAVSQEVLSRRRPLSKVGSLGTHPLCETHQMAQSRQKYRGDPSCIEQPEGRVSFPCARLTSKCLKDRHVYSVVGTPPYIEELPASVPFQPPLAHRLGRTLTRYFRAPSQTHIYLARPICSSPPLRYRHRACG